MKTGVVKIWDKEKNYGFITTDEDDDLFVHMRDLHTSIKAKRLFEGQRVTFDIRSDMKGDRAVNVRVTK